MKFYHKLLIIILFSTSFAMGQRAFYPDSVSAIPDTLKFGAADGNILFYFYQHDMQGIYQKNDSVFISTYPSIVSYLVNVNFVINPDSNKIDSTEYIVYFNVYNKKDSLLYDIGNSLSKNNVYSSNTFQFTVIINLNQTEYFKFYCYTVRNTLIKHSTVFLPSLNITRLQ